VLGPAFGTLLASQVGYGAAFLVAAVPLFVGALLAHAFLPAHVAMAAASHDEVDGSRGAVRRALFTPRLLLPYALSATLGLTAGVISALWAIYMLRRGASLELIGLSYTVYAIIALVLAPLAGRFSDRRGRYGPIVASLVIYAAIYCAYALPVSALWLVLLSATEGTAGGIARSALDGLLAEVTPASLRGRVQANYTAASTGGAFVMAALAGELYRFSPGLPFLVVGVAFAAACAGLLIPRVRRLFPARAMSGIVLDGGDAREAEVDVVVARGQ
jgi:MFS family permease